MRVSLGIAARGGLVCDSACVGACGGTWRRSGEVGLLADYIIIYGIDSGLRGRDAVEAKRLIGQLYCPIADLRDVGCRIIIVKLRTLCASAAVIATMEAEGPNSELHSSLSSCIWDVCPKLPEPHRAAVIRLHTEFLLRLPKRAIGDALPVRDVCHILARPRTFAQCVQ